MFLETMFFLFLGIGIGTIVGLIPGLHPNTVLVISLSFLIFLNQLPLYYSLAFVVALPISNTFVNFIPSILLGAPEDDGALGVLPGHRMLMQGEGHEAIFLTVIGGLGAVILTVITLPFLLFFMPLIFTNTSSYLHFLLIGIFLWMILTERGKNKLYAVFIFFIAGIFGIVSLNSLPSQFSLFPALTGLFGISTLIISLFTKNTIPEQMEPHEIKGSLKGYITGWFAGIFVGILPGIGSGQAGVIASQILRTKTKEFLTALGGINTANILFTFIVLFTLGKTRSGAAFTISQIVSSITYLDLIFMVLVAAITAFISTFITLKISRVLLKSVRSISYAKLNQTIIIFLIVLVVILSGPLWYVGILITITGIFIGLAAVLLGVRRTHMMGFLMLPTILFFSGIPISLLGL